MRSSFESIEDAIHPDRLSVVERSIQNHHNNLEPGKFRDDVFTIKAETASDSRRMSGLVSTESTFLHSAPQISSDCLNIMDRTLGKLKSGYAEGQYE